MAARDRCRIARLCSRHLSRERHPSAATPKAAHKTGFCASMCEKLERHDELQPVDQVVRVILGIVTDRTRPGQIAQIIDALSEKTRRLWHDAHRDGETAAK